MNNNLGKRIKFLREQKELSQLELAKILNISNSTLSQYEAGNRVPGDDIKNKIADYFNVSVDYLLGRTDDPIPYTQALGRINRVEMANFSDRLRQLRLENDLTQEQFGKIFGIVKFTVSLYENGKSTPDDETKKKIAEYFNVSLDYLMGFSDIRNPYKDKEEDHTKSDELIEYVIGEAEKHGYNLKDKSKEEIAKIIVKALKIDEISKSN